MVGEAVLKSAIHQVKRVREVRGAALLKAMFELKLFLNSLRRLGNVSLQGGQTFT